VEIKEFYDNLKEAYLDQNLNKITGKLIELYQNRDFDKIREIANRISKYIKIDEEKDARCFSKLIMLYHPDKAEAVRKSLDLCYINRDWDGLNQHAHIFCLDYIEHIKITCTVDADIDYSPEYRWDDFEESCFSVFDPNGGGIDTYNYYEDAEKSFYNAVKIRIYGDLEINFPTYYLEDFEDIELSSCEIEFLDGVEYCIHAVIIDLSDNSITDINGLWNLQRIEELYLSDNQLEIIDAISNLKNLRVLDLSSNRIDDISPLFHLEKLEFVNIIGNDIPQLQINELKSKGVVVMYGPK
jgi:hypothetical protein